MKSLDKAAAFMLPIPYNQGDDGDKYIGLQCRTMTYCVHDRQLIEHEAADVSLYSDLITQRFSIAISL